MPETSARSLRSPGRRLGVWLLAGAVVGFGAGQIRCASSSPGNVHPWGTYNTCLEAQVDTCTAVDGGCYQGTVTSSMSLGVDLDSGTAYLFRNPDAPVLGKQVGTRFELVMDTTDGGLTQLVCGCYANITETIWGELESASPTATCADAGESECLPDTDAGVPESWLAEADGGIDPSLTYPGLTAVAVDELTVADGGAADGGCPCLPCRVVYNISGTLQQ